MAIGNLDAHAAELDRHVAAGPLAVIGKKQKRHMLFEQAIDKLLRTGDQFRSPINDAIHVDQKTECATHHKLPSIGVDIRNRLAAVGRA